jgi:hypothetical protein
VQQSQYPIYAPSNTYTPEHVKRLKCLTSATQKKGERPPSARTVLLNIQVMYILNSEKARDMLINNFQWTCTVTCDLGTSGSRLYQGATLVFRSRTEMFCHWTGLSRVETGTNNGDNTHNVK